ncbi:hypothetical protein VCR4J2_300002 [Vibrio coralliirubri]|nr:hypothetical protein VCR4J2_300002 [Vibrio coralliirubri]
MTPYMVFEQFLISFVLNLVSNMGFSSSLGFRYISTLLIAYKS